MNRTVLVILILLLLAVCWMAGAEERTQYILCNPKPTNHVAIRRSPKKGAEEIGRLDCGDQIITDGKEKNGYVRILGMTEWSEGWVHKGYIVDDKPVIERCNANVAATGRVMSWRYVGKGRNGWLDIGTSVAVYARTDEWAVTSRGYVRMKYLEVWYED